VAVFSGVLAPDAVCAEVPLPEQALAAMRKTATFFRTKAAVTGGYVYYYSPDLTQRWAEGRATPQQILVQSPGTPAVGLASRKSPYGTDLARITTRPAAIRTLHPSAARVFSFVSSSA
jgi:hypothetical protein